eukprot:9313074-Pyramimonas_sp.AAC.1
MDDDAALGGGECGRHVELYLDPGAREAFLSFNEEASFFVLPAYPTQPRLRVQRRQHRGHEARRRPPDQES